MRLRPGYEVFWRAPGSSQVGLDHRCAVRLDGLSDAEQRLLDRLPAARGADELTMRGDELGLTHEEVAALLGRLSAAGVLVDSLPPGESDADDEYWHRAEVAGVPRRTGARSAAAVQVRGVDQVGLRVACELAQAGVGTVLLADDGPVLRVDVGGGLFRPSDVGGVREEVGVAVLRSLHPFVGVSAPVGHRPDLVVLVAHGVVDPVRVRELVREDVVHLPVLVRELDVVVGPVVRPGLGPCLRCLDLHRCDDDPRWPAVATQVAARRPRGVETSLCWSGAALAAHQVLAIVDGRPAAAEGTALEISAVDPVPVQRPWSVHRDCGCTATTLGAPPGAPAASRR